MERDGKGRSVGGKIFKVNVGSRRKNTELSDKGRITAGEVKREIKKKSVEI